MSTATAIADAVADVTRGLRNRGPNSRQHQQRDAAAASSKDRSFDLNALQTQIAPVFIHLATAYTAVQPALHAVYAALCTAWHALQPYHPQDLFVALYGIFLVFFGGIFMTLVASAEAAHQFGWDRIKSAATALYIEARNARAAFDRDSRVDANHDGIADVNTMDPTTLMARRMMVLSKSIDPNNVAVALEGLTLATVAILATLRVRFAKAITLGTAIGNVLHSVFSPLTSPLLEYALPTDYEKWVPVINRYAFRYAGVAASWVLMRAVTSVFAAMRGSSVLIAGVVAYLTKHGYADPRNALLRQGSVHMVAAWAAIAAVGIYFQVMSSFRLPFPLSLLLLPLTIAEQLVVFAVGSAKA